MKNSQKKVICRPCKEENNWEVETPGGKVLPNHFSTKQEAVRVGKKYAMEAGAELEVLNKTQTKSQTQTKTQKQTRKASKE